MKTKTFDSVRLMRELRDKLSLEMEHMEPEERMRHIRDKAASTEFGREVARTYYNNCGQSGSKSEGL